RSVGVVAVRTRLVEVELDRDLLAGLVDEVFLAVPPVEIGENPDPRVVRRASRAGGRDDVAQHGRDDLRVSIGVRPPARGIRGAIPRGGRGIEGPGDAAGPHAEGGTHRRIRALARGKYGARLRRRQAEEDDESDGDAAQTRMPRDGRTG